MKNIRIEKITLNVGTGKDQTKLDKAKVLLKKITGIDPIQTITNKRIAAWGLRPGLPIGCKITIRKKKATELLKNLLDANEFNLKDSQIDENGNIAFGIHEYIDIPGIKYDPKIGMMGLEVCATLERPGFRIKRRSIRKSKISPKHKITKEEAIEFMKNEFKVNIGE